jgi:hypothetical protein
VSAAAMLRRQRTILWLVATINLAPKPFNDFGAAPNELSAEV